MKILQLCKKMPYPLKDGEALAIHYLSKGYCDNGCIVDLLSFNTSKHFIEYKDVPEELSHYRNVEKIYLDTSLNYLAAIKY